MATNDWRRHTEETREAFDEFLEWLVSEVGQSPETEDYQYQKVNQYQARVNLHKEARKNTPLGQGDDVTAYYFSDLGMVMLDLNPTATED